MSPRIPARRVSAVSLAALAATLVTCAASTAAAQVPDLAHVGFEYLPPVDIADAAPARVSVLSYEVGLNVPIPVGKSTVLIPGLEYHVDSPSFSDTPAGYVPLDDVRSIEASLLVVQQLGSDWSLALRVAPGLTGRAGSVGAAQLAAPRLLGHGGEVARGDG